MHVHSTSNFFHHRHRCSLPKAPLILQYSDSTAKKKCFAHRCFPSASTLKNSLATKANLVQEARSPQRRGTLPVSAEQKQSILPAWILVFQTNRRTYAARNSKNGRTVMQHARLLQKQTPSLRCSERILLLQKITTENRCSPTNACRFFRGGLKQTARRRKQQAYTRTRSPRKASRFP